MRGSTTVQFTMVNGKAMIVMGMEFNYGQTELSMMVIGKIIKLMDQESFIILAVIITKATF